MPSDIEVEHNFCRSSFLRVGSFILIRELAEKLGLSSWLQGKFGNRNGGLILDMASCILIAEKNAAQHYPDYAYSIRCSPAT